MQGSSLILLTVPHMRTFVVHDGKICRKMILEYFTTIPDTTWYLFCRITKYSVDLRLPADCSYWHIIIIIIIIINGVFNVALSNKVTARSTIYNYIYISILLTLTTHSLDRLTGRMFDPNHLLSLFVLPSLKFLDQSKVISGIWHSGSNGRMSIAGYFTVTGRVPSSICSQPYIDLQCLADPNLSGTTLWTFPLWSVIRSVTGIMWVLSVDSQTNCFMRRYWFLQTNIHPNIEIRLSRILLQMLRCWNWLSSDMFGTKSSRHTRRIRRNTSGLSASLILWRSNHIDCLKVLWFLQYLF